MKLKHFCFWFCFAVMLLAAIDRTFPHHLHGRLVPSMLGKWCVGPVSPLSEDCWTSLGHRAPRFSPRNTHIVFRLFSAAAVLFLVVVFWRIANNAWRLPENPELVLLLPIACVFVAILMLAYQAFPRLDKPTVVGWQQMKQWAKLK